MHNAPPSQTDSPAPASMPLGSSVKLLQYGSQGFAAPQGVDAPSEDKWRPPPVIDLVVTTSPMHSLQAEPLQVVVPIEHAT
jgi:hypothetical protein